MLLLNELYPDKQPASPSVPSHSNLIAAVAKHTVWSEILNRSRISAKAQEMGVDSELPGAAFAVPIRILLATTEPRYWPGYP